MGETVGDGVDVAPDVGTAVGVSISVVAVDLKGVEEGETAGEVAMAGVVAWVTGVF